MEKQRIKRLCKSGKRLLTVLIFLQSFQIFAQSSSASKNNQKLIPVENQKLYPKQDIKYEILIPRVKSGNVLLQSQNLPSGIELRTVRKSEYYTEAGGTLLELWYRFEKKGVYTIPQLTVMINGRRRFYNFAKIQIEEDPANMMPRIVFQFDNGISISSDELPDNKPVFSISAGQKIKFRINLQYTTQLVHFSWEIPEDSIFKQTQAFEITEIKYREKKYTNELIPVADFEWSPLTKGNVHLPKIKLVATAYKGYRSELSMPAFFIAITDSTESNSSEANTNSQLQDSFLEEAFNQNYRPSLTESQTMITEEHCKTLAQMHSRERNIPFINKKAINERKELEEMFGLPSESEEFNLGFLYLFAATTIVFSVLLLIFIAKKKNLSAIITTVFLICSIVMISYSWARLIKQYGISKGCVLYSIPETNAKSTSEIRPGNRVSIVEKAGNWYFVELGTISGWCQKDDIIVIR